MSFSYNLLRLWESGWKERYYENKFDVNTDDTEFRDKVVRFNSKNLKEGTGSLFDLCLMLWAILTVINVG